MAAVLGDFVPTVTDGWLLSSVPIGGNRFAVIDGDWDSPIVRVYTVGDDGSVTEESSLTSGILGSDRTGAQYLGSLVSTGPDRWALLTILIGNSSVGKIYGWRYDASSKVITEDVSTWTPDQPDGDRGVFVSRASGAGDSTALVAHVVGTVGVTDYHELRTYRFRWDEVDASPVLLSQRNHTTDEFGVIGGTNGPYPYKPAAMLDALPSGNYQIAVGIRDPGDPFFPDSYVVSLSPDGDELSRTLIPALNPTGWDFNWEWIGFRGGSFYGVTIDSGNGGELLDTAAFVKVDFDTPSVYEVLGEPLYGSNNSASSTYNFLHATEDSLFYMASRTDTSPYNSLVSQNAGEADVDLWQFGGFLGPDTSMLVMSDPPINTSTTKWYVYEYLDGSQFTRRMVGETIAFEFTFGTGSRTSRMAFRRVVRH